MTATTKPPMPDAVRARRYKSKGRQIACVLRDPAALAALTMLEAKHGGVTAAITAVLKSAALHQPDKSSCAA